MVPWRTLCRFSFESSLLRVIVKFSCLWQGPRHSLSFFSALFVSNCTHEAHSSAMYLHCVVSWCSVYHFRVPGSVSCSRERIVIEIIAALQMSFLWQRQPLFLKKKWGEAIWEGASDEHCKVCWQWSCDEHHTTLVSEDRTRQFQMRFFCSWNPSQRLSLQMLHCVV